MRDNNSNHNEKFKLRSPVKSKFQKLVQMKMKFLNLIIEARKFKS